MTRVFSEIGDRLTYIGGLPTAETFALLRREREVVRVVSPGTFTDANYLEAKEPAFLMAVAPGDPRHQPAFGVALLDGLYTRGGVAVNHKYRKFGADKAFRQDPGAVKTFWNADTLSDPSVFGKPVVVTEIIVK